MANLERAANAFKAFTGREPKHVDKYPLDAANVAGYKLGQMVGVAYEATRDGERSQYFHKFKADHRPTLAVREDGRQLYVVGGKYTVTDRGIEDKTMASLFVVNPSSRRRKTRSKAPMARRRKATRRRSRVTIMRANPVRRRRTHRRRRSVALVARRNPIRRRRSTRRRMSFRRNPTRALGGLMSMSSMLIPGAFVGAGAVGAEILNAYLPIPPAFKTGIWRHVTKGAVGIAGGMLLAKLGKQRKLGEYMALGAIVVATHDIIKDVMTQSVPGIKMSEYVPGMGYNNPALIANAGFSGVGMNEYVNASSPVY